MVTTDIAQLSRECNAWRETLRSYREQFAELKNRLQAVAGRQNSRHVLQEVEHLDNQFHIQLINIHDLKHSIKSHDRQIQMEVAARPGQISDETLTYHENLYDEYERLEHKLHDLRQEFDDFLGRTR